MNETQVIKNAPFLLFGDEMLRMVWDLRWLISLAVVLVTVDLWFGLKASHFRKEEIRKSRAGRCTMGKMIDYFCYLILGGFIGQALGEPFGISYVVVAASCMGLACLFELDSILHNVCLCRGVQTNLSATKLFVALVRNRSGIVGKTLEKEWKPNKTHPSLRKKQTAPKEEEPTPITTDENESERD